MKAAENGLKRLDDPCLRCLNVNVGFDMLGADPEFSLLHYDGP